MFKNPEITNGNQNRHRTRYFYLSLHIAMQFGLYLPPTTFCTQKVVGGLAYSLWGFCWPKGRGELELYNSLYSPGYRSRTSLVRAFARINLKTNGSRSFLMLPPETCTQCLTRVRVVDTSILDFPPFDQQSSLLIVRTSRFLRLLVLEDTRSFQHTAKLSQKFSSRKFLGDRTATPRGAMNLKANSYKLKAKSFSWSHLLPRFLCFSVRSAPVNCLRFWCSP